MATSIGLEQFARRMTIVARGVRENTTRIVQRAALAADQAVVLATPVDTGRARANWITSIGTPRLTATDATDKSGASSIAQGADVISRWRVGLGPIFIANSVPYILRLEEGSSRQAPSGMTRFAIQAARAQFRNARVLQRT